MARLWSPKEGKQKEALRSLDQLEELSRVVIKI